MVELRAENVPKVKPLEDYDNEDELQQLLDNTKDFVVRRKIRVVLRALKARNGQINRQSNRNTSSDKPIINSTSDDTKLVESQSSKDGKISTSNKSLEENECNNISDNQRQTTLENSFPEDTDDIKKGKCSINVEPEASTTDTRQKISEINTDKQNQNPSTVLKRFPLANPTKSFVSKKNELKHVTSTDSNIKNRYQLYQLEKKATPAKKITSYDFRSALRSSKDRVQTSVNIRSTNDVDSTESENTIDKHPTTAEVSIGLHHAATNKLTYSIEQINEVQMKKKEDLSVTSISKAGSHKAHENPIKTKVPDEISTVVPADDKASMEAILSRNKIIKQKSDSDCSTTTSSLSSPETKSEAFIESPDISSNDVQNLGSRAKTNSNRISDFNVRRDKFNTDRMAAKKLIQDDPKVGVEPSKLDSKKNITESHRNSKELMGNQLKSFVNDEAKLKKFADSSSILDIKIEGSNTRALHDERLNEESSHVKSSEADNIEKEKNNGESYEDRSDDDSKQNISQDMQQETDNSGTFSLTTEKSKQRLTDVQGPNEDSKSDELFHTSENLDNRDQETNKSCEQSNNYKSDDDRPRLPSLSSYKKGKGNPSDITSKGKTLIKDMPSSLKTFHSDKPQASQDQIKDFRSVLRKRNEQTKQSFDNKKPITSSDRVSDGIKRFSNLKSSLKSVTPKPDYKSDIKEDVAVGLAIQHDKLKGVSQADKVDDTMEGKNPQINVESNKDNNSKDLPSAKRLSMTGDQSTINEEVKGNLDENKGIENVTNSHRIVADGPDSKQKESNFASPSLINKTASVRNSSTDAELKHPQTTDLNEPQSSQIERDAISKSNRFKKPNSIFQQAVNFIESTDSHPISKVRNDLKQTAGSVPTNSNVALMRNQFLATIDNGNNSKSSDKRTLSKDLNQENSNPCKSTFKERTNQVMLRINSRHEKHSEDRSSIDEKTSGKDDDESKFKTDNEYSSHKQNVKSRSQSARAAFFGSSIKKDDKSNTSSRFNKDGDKKNQSKSPFEKISRFKSVNSDQNGSPKYEKFTKDDSPAVQDKKGDLIQIQSAKKSFFASNESNGREDQSTSSGIRVQGKFRESLKNELPRKIITDRIDSTVQKTYDQQLRKESSVKECYTEHVLSSQSSYRHDLRKDYVDQESRNNKGKSWSHADASNTNEMSTNKETISEMRNNRGNEESLIVQLRNNETKADTMDNSNDSLDNVYSGSRKLVNCNTENIKNQGNQPDNDQVLKQQQIEKTKAKIKAPSDQPDNENVQRREKNQYRFRPNITTTLPPDKRRETFIQFSEEPSSPKAIRAISVLEPIQNVSSSFKEESDNNKRKEINSVNVKDLASTPSSPTGTPRNANPSTSLGPDKGNDTMKEASCKVPTSDKGAETRKAVVPAAGYIRKFEIKKPVGRNVVNDPKSKRPKPFVTTAPKLTSQPEKKQKKSGLKDLFKKATKTETAKKPTESTAAPKPAAKQTPKTEGSVSAILLQWCKLHTKGYEYKDIMVKDLSRSWADGLAFCALLNNLIGRDTIPMDDLDTTTKEKNFTLAFEAFDKVGIAPLLDVEDMLIMYPRPDQRCVMTYLLTIYSRYKDC
ncbi:Cytospin-A [Trichoplax sp. H2]|nr:Cytospin-A [Trichoplax sp. H2]|eukprot:RDD47292.1 Cytospin-A [Trichoplax sp. H2]